MSYLHCSLLVKKTHDYSKLKAGPEKQKTSSEIMNSSLHDQSERFWKGKKSLLHEEMRAVPVPGVREAVRKRSFMSPQGLVIESPRRMRSGCESNLGLDKPPQSLSSFQSMVPSPHTRYDRWACRTPYIGSAKKSSYFVPLSKKERDRIQETKRHFTQSLAHPAMNVIECYRSMFVFC